MATATAGSVKSTVYLDRYNKEQLEYLVSIDQLASVTDGINLAIAEFVKQKRRELYAAQMKEASADADFMARTMTAQKEFDRIDSGVDAEW